MRAAVLALLLAGCGGHTWLVDERFSEADEVDIEAAAELWRGAGMAVDLAYGQHVTGHGQFTWEIVIVSERAMANIDADSGGTPAVARCQSDGVSGRIWVARDLVLSQQQMRFTIAHELGHSFGMKHLQDTGALLHHNWQDGVTKMCVTKADSDELCRATGCVGKVKGCDE